MTKRSGDWDLVGHASDPIEASESEVRTVADAMRSRADEADEIKRILKAVSDLDGWRGKAAEAFADKADDVLEDLGKVVQRYEAVATALDSWKTNVETGRNDTWSALKKAEAAQKTVDENKPFEGEGEAPTGQDKTDETREGAEGDLGRAVSQMREAMEVLNRAARDRKNDIEDAAEIWDDGWWGDFKGSVRDMADVIHRVVEVLKIIALVLGALILVLVFTIGAPFALVVAAIVLSVAILAGTLLLYAADTGHYSGADVGWALVDVALSLVGGKAASAALRGIKSLAPQVASRLSQTTKAAALNRLISGKVTQFNNALKISNPSNNLARWTQKLTGAAAQEGQRAADDLIGLINTAPTKLPATVAESLRNGGRELAGLNQQLAALRRATDDAAHALQLDKVARNIKIEQIVFTTDFANKVRDAVGSVPKLPETFDTISGKDPQ
ncbi:MULTISPECIES: WXG100 family type VII secretion target [Mumia]|uniref:WXG100 family type VII secretion target n=1 Tax=Mumia TaxID=1546255 RepID=UPI00141F1F3B|nr:MULTISPECIES: hypothetical protein [unclassified Mumia]QMW67958.1 hypothetical protein H4N58_08990 [Mumia sp. ZJ1417]